MSVILTASIPTTEHRWLYGLCILLSGLRMRGVHEARFNGANSLASRGPPQIHAHGGV